MRDSACKFLEGIVVKASRLFLLLGLLMALGLNPVVMQKHMGSATASQEMAMADAPDMQHGAQTDIGGGYCLQMAPCTAVLQTPLQARLLNFEVASLSPVAVPLADSRAPAPPFQPPIA